MMQSMFETMACSQPKTTKSLRGLQMRIAS